MSGTRTPEDHQQDIEQEMMEEYYQECQDQQWQDAMYEIPYDQRTEWALQNRERYFPQEFTRQNPRRAESTLRHISDIAEEMVLNFDSEADTSTKEHRQCFTPPTSPRFLG